MHIELQAGLQLACPWRSKQGGGSDGCKGEKLKPIPEKATSWLPALFVGLRPGLPYVQKLLLTRFIPPSPSRPR
jgi:hypothetical protein